jgi:hypothetical protein
VAGKSNSGLSRSDGSDEEGRVKALESSAGEMREYSGISSSVCRIERGDLATWQVSSI